MNPLQRSYFDSGRIAIDFPPPPCYVSRHVKDDTARKLIKTCRSGGFLLFAVFAVRCGGPDMFPVFLTGPTAGITAAASVASLCCAPTMPRAYNAARRSAAAVRGLLPIPALRMPQGSTGTSIARHPA